MPVNLQGENKQFLKNVTNSSEPLGSKLENYCLGLD